MALTKKEKKELLEQYKTKLENAKALFVINPKGLTPNQVSELKKQLFEINSSFNVVKNSIFKIALKEINIEIPIEKGEHAVLFANVEDFTSAAKILYEFMKEAEDLEFKVGFVEQNIINKIQFEELANLPSREVLIAQVLNVMQAPITGFVRVLNGNITQFINVINAIKEQKDN